MTATASTRSGLEDSRGRALGIPPPRSHHACQGLGPRRPVPAPIQTRVLLVHQLLYALPGDAQDTARLKQWPLAPGVRMPNVPGFEPRRGADNNAPTPIAARRHVEAVSLAPTGTTKDLFRVAGGEVYLAYPAATWARLLPVSCKRGFVPASPVRSPPRPSRWRDRLGGQRSGGKSRAKSYSAKYKAGEKRI